MEAEDETRGRMPPIKVKFEIPYFTVSGIQVRRSGCLPVAWQVARGGAEHALLLLCRCGT